MSRALATSGRERRSAPRYPLGLSVELTTASGVTMNVSATGVLFETVPGAVLHKGHPVCFRLLLRAVAGQVRCRGRVVRVECAGPRCIVASTIDNWELDVRTDGGLLK
jgi:hypothetical protein